MKALMGLDVNSNALPKNMSEFKRNFSQNTGNLLFHYATENILKVKKRTLQWNSSKSILESESNGIVIPMANQIGPHFDLMSSGPNVDGATKVTLLGLGAQFGIGEPNIKKIPRGTSEWLGIVASKNYDAPNIAVRGNYTLNIMKKLGFGENTIALGCQSNLINHNKNLGEIIHKKIKSYTTNKIKGNISINAGSYRKDEHSSLESIFINWVTEGLADYIVQNPKELISLSNGWYDEVTVSQLTKIQENWFPNIEKEKIKDWFLNKSKVYISIPQWLLDMSKKSLVIGTRIHGVQAAIQAGTPALCFCVDSRTKELCEFMKIPHIMADDACEIDIDQILNILNKWDHKEFDQNRIAQARKTKRFIISNKGIPTEHLRALTN